MKSITIAGNIGKDAVVRVTQGGDKIASFSVAVEERNGKEKTTLWFYVSMWGARGEALVKYLTKGTKVAVSGDLSRREHEGKTYLTVRANDVTLLGGGEKREDRRPEAAAASAGRGPDFDDEIPFAPEWRA